MSFRVNRRRFMAASAGLATGAAAARVVPAGTGQWGDLTGRLVYEGAAPERKKLKVDKDVDCCGKYDIRDESLMVGPEGGLANVYVYVRSRRVKICPELEEAVGDKVLLDNRDCIFKPHCMTVWITKQVYHIVNSDPIAQNVAFSPLGDVPANIIMPPKGDPVDWKFRRSQSIPVLVKCNYHPWESAYVLPKDHPYVAITDMDGVFRIPRLPTGELEFQVWQERTGYVDTPQWRRGRFKLTIQPGTNDLGTIKLPPALFAR
ncbi:MAG TPA: hypothetical protein EYP56_02740 [Planctomycetaceae bacterium]|nr:hypothetical protein [Planctomycetaceae bacterium]